LATSMRAPGSASSSRRRTSSGSTIGSLATRAARMEQGATCPWRLPSQLDYPPGVESGMPMRTGEGALAHHRPTLARMQPPMHGCALARHHATHDEPGTTVAHVRTSMRTVSCLALSMFLLPALARPAAAACTNVSTANEICSPSADPCVVDKAYCVAIGSALDFGTRTLT